MYHRIHPIRVIQQAPFPKVSVSVMTIRSIQFTRFLSSNLESLNLKMKNLIVIGALIAAAQAASDDFTIRLTTISSYSSCPPSSAPVLPVSSFGHYANYSSTSVQDNIPTTSALESSLVTESSISLAAGLLPSSSRSRVVSYEYETEYETDISSVTRTVCDLQGACYVTTDLESLTTRTTTIDGILTVITTAVPIQTHDASQTIAGANQASVPSSQDTRESLTMATVETESNAEPAPTEPIESTETTDCYTSVVTITTCHENLCSLTAVTTAVSVYTVDYTVYTTWIPLVTETISSSHNYASTIAAQPSSVVHSSEAAQLVDDENSIVTNYLTTLVTITSCKDNKCSEVPQTTGVKIISLTDTVYTTYCPLSELPESTAEAEAVATTSSSPVTGSESHSVLAESSTVVEESKSLVTVNVITNNIVTESPTSSPSSSSSSSLLLQTGNFTSVSTGANPHTISTYEGAAAISIDIAATGFFGAVLSIILFLI
ncbi:hypothetical protein KGF56_001542 [Candida oxycetoniae]|uniref:Uncharacterized protein n=1 Tax=Candida oxycetoniae TaxID=497107 RepID=A0AAI9SZ04_9ASCO|nr:uncharacterized protein KGF56_001542 [Candida oxycetoniae]KAI3405524.2 hypothetical protein KGF56_001542 [Candida oxycetoniae]